MKKSLFLCLFFIFSCQFAAAQRPPGINPAAWDEMIANRAVQLSLSASKSLLEANEHTNLVINIMVPPTMTADGTVGELPSEVPLPIGAASPYRATNWKILHGGGQLITIDENTYDYAAPATAPADKTMTISVDLLPTRPNFPKVVLLQTLYFTETETAVYVNLPQAGFNGSKYIIKMNGGAKVPTTQGMDPRAAARMPPDIQAKMAQAQAAMQAAQQQSGINLSAVSSNAMALYNADHNLTTVRFNGLTIQMSAGRAAAPNGESVLFTFDFKGKGVGNYPLTQDDVGVGFGVPASPKKVGCGNNQRSSSGKDMPCNGSVTITSMDDKIIKGFIRTSVYTSDGKIIYRGSLYGKFTVNRVN